jgi:mRNA interferase RelE/StbE
MLARIDRATSERIQSKVCQLADNPAALANNIKAMKGEVGLFRLRVGDWRVVFTETLVVLTIVRVAPRGGVYD